MIINGQEISKKIISNLLLEVKKIGITPELVIIVVGNNPSNTVYVKNKVEKAKQAGIGVGVYKFDQGVETKVVEDLIFKLNQDRKVHGIILQLPVSDHLNHVKLINLIDPKKDVDGLHPQNLGLLYANSPKFIPCTALGCLHLIKEVCDDLSGKNIVIINRSILVGKPLAALLLQQNATVTICHSHTKNLKDITNNADVVVTAIGKPNFFTKEYFSRNAIVIDIGINKDEGKIHGDVSFNDIKQYVKAITPVPGGVGPMTVAYLLKNTLLALKDKVEI